MKVVSSAKLKKELAEELIRKFPSISFNFYKNIDEARGSLEDADILITYGEDLTDQIIEKANTLKWIMVISAGLDQMPFAAIKKKGILVTNARGIHQIPMAEYTLAMILQVARQTKQLIKNEEAHIWDRLVPMTELNGKTIGILGTGAIGTQIAKYAKVFNMNTIGFNRSGRIIEEFEEMVTIETIDKLLNNSDFIVSVLPSTKETDGLLNKQMFEKMKETAVFINIGRGKNIVESDLIEVLDKGKLAHAVLDVFEEEPLPKGHPFWDSENITVTPHLSGISAEYQPRAIAIFERNLHLFLAGSHDLENIIDLEKGY